MGDSEKRVRRTRKEIEKEKKACILGNKIIDNGLYQYMNTIVDELIADKDISVKGSKNIIKEETLKKTSVFSPMYIEIRRLEKIIIGQSELIVDLINKKKEKRYDEK